MAPVSLMLHLLRSSKRLTVYPFARQAREPERRYTDIRQSPRRVVYHQATSSSLVVVVYLTTMILGALKSKMHLRLTAHRFTLMGVLECTEEIKDPSFSFDVQRHRLSCPVVIPQRSPGSKGRGFMRAYAPVLADYDFGEESFLAFLKSFHKASMVMKWPLQGLLPH